MAGGRQLRAVSMPSGASASRNPDSAQKKSRDFTAWLLAAVLVVTLALLGWSRAELGGRISLLEEEVRTLSTAVAERDHVIAAQRERIGDVRSRVDELRVLLDRPLPSAE